MTEKELPALSIADLQSFLRRRFQTDLWPGLAIRSCRVCVVARSNRAADENCSGRRGHHERHRGP
jgi:hypothetical protein